MSAEQPAIKCRHCGATPRPGDPCCWLCFAPVAPAAAASEAKQSASPQSPAEAGLGANAQQVNPFQLGAQVSGVSGTDSLVTLAVTLLLLLMIFTVGVSLYQAAPGAAILFGVFVVVPLVRTMMVSQDRRNRGKTPGIARQIELFVTSMSVMFGILLLWLLSAFVGVLGLCFAAAGVSSSGGNPEIALFVFGGGYLLVVLFLTGAIVRSQYRKDVDRD